MCQAQTQISWKVKLKPEIGNPEGTWVGSGFWLWVSKFDRVPDSSFFFFNNKHMYMLCTIIHLLDRLVLFDLVCFGCLCFNSSL